jgi:hypothetical protein
MGLIINNERVVLSIWVRPAFEAWVIDWSTLISVAGGRRVASGTSPVTAVATLLLTGELPLFIYLLVLLNFFSEPDFLLLNYNFLLVFKLIANELLSLE